MYTCTAALTIFQVSFSNDLGQKCEMFVQPVDWFVLKSGGGDTGIIPGMVFPHSMGNVIEGCFIILCTGCSLNIVFFP